MGDEIQALRHVRPVVPDRIGHRVRHHDQGGAVDDRADLGMFGEDAVDQRTVRDITGVERVAGRELDSARHQVIQDHWADARVGQG